MQRELINICIITLELFGFGFSSSLSNYITIYFSPALFCLLFKDKAYYFLGIVKIPLVAEIDAEKKPAPYFTQCDSWGGDGGFLKLGLSCSI